MSVPDWLKETLEKKAAHRLETAKQLLKNGEAAKAKVWFKEIVRDYPGTVAAREAQELESKR